MKLGIVGHAAEKFTWAKQQEARKAIQYLIDLFEPELIVSGACHMGGIDIWAIEEAKKWGIPYKEFPPATLKWEGGYKQRNMQIAEASDVVCSMVVTEFPPDYKGMRFPYCYHCKTDHHIKSGGCWTVKYASTIGKDGMIFEI